MLDSPRPLQATVLRYGCCSRGVDSRVINPQRCDAIDEVSAGSFGAKNCVFREPLSFPASVFSLPEIALSLGQ
jgi:hypothetical protein